MIDRFRQLSNLIVKRNVAVKGFVGAASPATTQTDIVTLEHLTKLQNEYSALLARLNTATDKLNRNTRQGRSLWASLAIPEYFDLIFRAHEAYAKLAPFWEPTILPAFSWHWDYRVVRSKSMNRIQSLPNLVLHAKCLRGEQAAILMSLLQEELDDHFESSDHVAILRLLQDLSDEADELPANLWLKGVKKRTRRAYAGDQDVWVGTHIGKEVAVREFWFPSSIPEQRLRKILRREILANRRLNHPNVLRLIGVFNEEPQPMSVVTPWMANGEAMLYLESHPAEFLHVIQGAADGMDYLHSMKPPIVHGDIRPRNILINAEGDAVIRDLGLTRVRHEVSRTHDEHLTGSSPRHTAPELLNPTDIFAISSAADCYSLSIVYYELATQKKAFEHLKSIADIKSMVLKGVRPFVPFSRIQANICDEDVIVFGELLKDMWHGDAARRPSMASVATSLKQYENRTPCVECFDQHRSRECVRMADNEPCSHCVSLGVECQQLTEYHLTSGRGYGTHHVWRVEDSNGYNTRTLELPPSPDGVLTPIEVQTATHLVPFTWHRRRRPSAAHIQR